MRQIVGTEGYLTYNALDVVVGLGDAARIDTIRFEWPSGLVEELKDVPVKQTLTIVEGSMTGEQLNITRTSDTVATLTWSSGAYLLETTDDLGRSAWARVNGVSGSSHLVTLEGQRFYRLKRR